MADHVQGTAALSRSDHRAIAAHDDCRLLFSDRLNGVAKVLLMIESNVGHHRNAAIPRMCGIKSAPETNLDDRRGDLLLS